MKIDESPMMMFAVSETKEDKFEKIQRQNIVHHIRRYYSYEMYSK